MELLSAGSGGKTMRSEVAAHASLRRHYPYRFQGCSLTRPPEMRTAAARTPSVDRQGTPKCRARQRLRGPCPPDGVLLYPSDPYGRPQSIRPEPSRDWVSPRPGKPRGGTECPSAAARSSSVRPPRCQRWRWGCRPSDARRAPRSRSRTSFRAARSTKVTSATAVPAFAAEVKADEGRAQVRGLSGGVADETIPQFQHCARARSTCRCSRCRMRAEKVRRPTSA